MKSVIILLLIGIAIVFAFKIPPKSPVLQDDIKKKAGGPDIEKDIEVVVRDLEIPWEVAFLPNNEFLITERPGRLVRIGRDRRVIEVEGVHHIGEGGLMGMTLHPKFAENSFIYLYFTTRQEDRITNRVERYKFQNDALTGRRLIIGGILGSSVHDGGRIEFGPDGYLYITTGDAGNSDLAQNKNSPNGKILRVKDDGSIPADNPFGSAVYSYGHRNAQGLTWDKDKRLWATEHGRSGIQSGLDELNLIESGKNYGWPQIQGDQERVGMIRPVINSGPSETWAPAGATYASGRIFFAGLRGETLYEAQIDGVKLKTLKKHLVGKYGRLRAVRLGPDGYLYITTSNRDGRGNPRPDDDKLIRINPRAFQ